MKLQYLKCFKTYSPFVLALILAIPCFFSTLTDDAYIHARIVRNFIETGFPCYNYGDAFKASSSTGYLLLLRLFSSFFDVLSSIRIVNFLAVFSVVLMFFQFCKKSKNLLACFVIFLPIPSVLNTSYSGMETNLSILCLLISAYFIFLNSNIILGLIFAALTVLFRTEFSIYYVLILTYTVFVHKSRLQVIPSLLIFFAIYSIDLFFYGTIVPHAAQAKSIAYSCPKAETLFVLLFRWTNIWCTLLTILLFLRIVCYDIKSFQHKRILPISVYTVFLLCMLLAWGLLSGTGLFFFWYEPIFYTPLSLIFFFYCYDKNFLSDNKNQREFHRINEHTINFIIIAIVASSFVPNQYQRLLTSSFTTNKRTSTYIKIAKELQKTHPDTQITTSEIGALGYYFKGAIYDGLGLGDHTAMQFHPMSVPEQRSSCYIGAIPLQYVVYRESKLIVTLPIFIEEFSKSRIYDEFHHYYCPFEENVRFMGDLGVEIHSKFEFPEEMLNTLQCAQK